MPEQSTEYDYDGSPENGLPPLGQARANLVRAISEWGDGDPSDDYGFHTRDMCALLDALDRVDNLIRAAEYQQSATLSRDFEGRPFADSIALSSLRSAMGYPPEQGVPQ